MVSARRLKQAGNGRSRGIVPRLLVGFFLGEIAQPTSVMSVRRCGWMLLGVVAISSDYLWCGGQDCLVNVQHAVPEELAAADIVRGAGQDGLNLLRR